MSDDGADWHHDLDARFVEDLRALDDDSSLLVARAPDGGLVGAAIVEWTVGRRVRFATLADLTIEPAQRSSGLGAQMVAEIEREARHRGMQWIFLESGKDNRRAHAFFERHAFHEISHVFGKALT
ncbi:GNAT family N-acetyltransferase [Hephaestia sp. GCM10023244]|uniref:GNAT family N-acetyltransferase n=1 Tax=unclassified Hephaestia TaxID=2631281 RepID=UPI00207728F2|nr:GNAT family N-acetyltransferase [Hephaestia sp. MAHUQ-44]MCM8730363.1 GNAT family N-acetyltransferase [Hephaestia sp. MAHUQ-44]